VKLVTKNVFTAMPSVLACLAAILLVVPAASAQDTEVRGFVENATYVREHGVGLTKSRTTLQLELSKAWTGSGLFSEFSLHGTFRGSYDAVYDLNDDTFGKNSGRSLSFPAPGNPAFFGILRRFRLLPIPNMRAFSPRPS
jgi:hypothetical protein